MYVISLICPVQFNENHVLFKLINKISGEYSSIVLFSCITAILFLGGYNFPEIFVNDSFFNIQAIILGLKTCLFCFLFVLVRATLPRLRYDQLIDLC